MSAVRMCDRCGQIFKEGEEGSATGQVIQNLRDERTGRIVPTQVVQDICAGCGSFPGPSAPRLALTGEALSEEVAKRLNRIKEGD